MTGKTDNMYIHLYTPHFFDLLIDSAHRHLSPTTFPPSFYLKTLFRICRTILDHKLFLYYFHRKRLAVSPFFLKQLFSE
jgi:hypothetical protein